MISKHKANIFFFSDIAAFTCAIFFTHTTLSVLALDELAQCKHGFFKLVQPRSIHSNESTNITCELCPIGTYNNESNQVSCNRCPAGSTNLINGSTILSDCNVCQPGYFMNYVFECQMCPRNSHNAKFGSVGIQSCNPCRYLEFQPRPGQATCIRKNVELPIAVSDNDHVVGLFVEDDTSCVYITSDYSGKTDRICWGLVGNATHEYSDIWSHQNMYPELKYDVLPLIRTICGDGIIYPLLEECDDGNYISSDGCSPSCKIETGFGCELSPPTKDQPTSLRAPSRCCRISQSPFFQTGKCSPCYGRIPPYAGVKYDPQTCELKDIDECASVLTNNCFHSSKLCVNFDAMSTSQHRYKCMCASPLPPHCTDLDIDHGAYTVRGVIAVFTTNVSSTIQNIYHQTAKLLQHIPVKLTQTTTVIELEHTNTSSGSYIDFDASKFFFELSFLCESWQDMQLIALQMNLTALGDHLLT
jgi:cysteine-rich repeat protein